MLLHCLQKNTWESFVLKNVVMGWSSSKCFGPSSCTLIKNGVDYAL